MRANSRYAWPCLTVTILLVTPCAAVHAQTYSVQTYSVERARLHLDGQARFLSTAYDFESFSKRATALLFTSSVQYLVTPGQDLGLTRRYPLQAAFAPESGDVAGQIVGGLLLGAVGFFGGGLIGYGLETSGGCEGDYWCGVGGAALGAVIGETIGLPLGVHLANKRRGNYGLSLLASVGVTTLGILLAAGADTGTPLLAVPVLQLAVSIPIERSTSRK